MPKMGALITQQLPALVVEVFAEVDVTKIQSDGACEEHIGPSSGGSLVAYKQNAASIEVSIEDSGTSDSVERLEEASGH
jgi:hypothetical protein